MTIRYASSNDFDRIYEIEKRVFSNPWSKESIKKELDNDSKSLNLISEIDGQLMGYFKATGPQQFSLQSPQPPLLLLPNLVALKDMLSLSKQQLLK